MAKQAKIAQTDYTKGGRDISNTAIPLYQQNLTRMDEFNADPTAYIDMYRDKYYDNTTEQSDFMRNYQRAMAQRTGANYAATSGGYSSEGQRAYDDTQRYWNDQAARLYDQGVANAANMAQQYYTNLINANAPYQNAYSLGKDYSDTERYNDLVEQGKNNWVGQSLKTIAPALAFVPGVGLALSAAASAAGDAMQVDTSSAMGTVMSQMGADAAVKAGLAGKYGQPYEQLSEETVGALAELFGDGSSGLVNAYNTKVHPKVTAGLNNLQSTVKGWFNR